MLLAVAVAVVVIWKLSIIMDLTKPSLLVAVARGEAQEVIQTTKMDRFLVPAAQVVVRAHPVATVQMMAAALRVVVVEAAFYRVRVGLLALAAEALLALQG
jgi:hypothetical protein